MIETDDRSGLTGEAPQHSGGGLLTRPKAYAVYALALIPSILVWFLGVTTPLRLDETGSYWKIAAGVSGIWNRQFLPPPPFPLYSYILWFSTRLIGASEAALRTPSLLAMLAAAWLLYRIARDLFEPDIAILAIVIFCLNPIVIYEAAEARPYAFALLATNAAILVLLRLRTSNSSGLAALFGFLAACILYFHYLFAVILPAFVLCFLVFKRRDRKACRRQLAIGLAAFALAFLPLIPGLLYLFRTADVHVSGPPPNWMMLVWTLAPGWLIVSFGFVAILSAARLRSSRRPDVLDWKILFCVSLALVPVFVLFGISIGTSIHIFAERYRLVAMPGVSFCWAMVLSRFRAHLVRPVFAVVFVAVSVIAVVASPHMELAGAPWKDALEVVERNASADNAPVLMCSEFIESNHVVMPVDSAKDSFFFAPLSYYKLSVPVVPLPESLNAETIRVASPFLRQAAQKHERFLALGYLTSYETLNWIEKSASGAYTVRSLGGTDGFRILEFDPRTNAVAQLH